MTKKNMMYIALMVLVVAILIFVKMCATFPKSNPAFEQEIAEFYEEKKPGSMIHLFNGIDLSGWEVHGFGRWTVEGEVLTYKRGVGYLATKYDGFDDFILTLDIRAWKKSNSGVFFRSPHAKGLWPWPKGYEAQVDNNDPKNPTGSLYNIARASQLLSKDGEWFEMKITAVGHRVEIAIDGETVVDTTIGEYQKSFIALQAHDVWSRVDFKNIRLEIVQE